MEQVLHKYASAAGLEGTVAQPCWAANLIRAATQEIGYPWLQPPPISKRKNQKQAMTPSAIEGWIRLVEMRVAAGWVRKFPVSRWI